MPKVTAKHVGIGGIVGTIAVISLGLSQHGEIWDFVYKVWIEDMVIETIEDNRQYPKLELEE